MRWKNTAPGFHYSECGRGRVMPCAIGFTPYFREAPQGPWKPILTPAGQYAYRKSVPAACEAVRDAVEKVDRMREKEAA